MRSRRHDQTHHDQKQYDETRAEVARRRLAQLAAAFEADAVPPESAPAHDPDPAPERQGRLTGAHLRVVGVVGVAALIVLAWMLLAGRPETGDPVEPLTLSSSSATSTPGPDLVIDVVGEVKKPGIVTVPRGARVYQAIEEAGGLDGTVDTSGVNLARVLEDGEQVIVGPASELPGGVGAAGAKVSLNSSTVEQFETLSGVGPVTAQAIVSWRDEHGRFAAIEDLLDVRGIGDATFGELRDLVVL